jgi:REP element-mobilizing transposase RayT
MPRPIRMLSASEIFFVTVRCFQRRYLLTPSTETNELLGGVLARAVRLHGVELFAFSIISNHIHLVVRAPRGNLPRFMQYLSTNVSKKVARVVDWRGSFWERRYSAEPILDQTALLERVRYLLSHGVKEGLVRRCRDWPGLSCLSFLLDGKSRTFRWFDWTRRSSGNPRRVTRPRLDKRWAECEELRLTPLPNPALQSRQAVRAFVRRSVRAIEEQASCEYQTVLGRAGVLRQDPHTRPPPARTRKPRPPCHTSIRELFDGFREQYRSFLEKYREASIRWRNGDFTAIFPEAAIKPFVWPRSAAIPLAA